MPSSLPADALPTAEDLEVLLEMLYPELPLVDILTLSDFKFRYRFSGLGVGAVTAIERAQRITRAIGNYDQMGLSEFHNGLIYLHERQFLGALPYFAEARRYWDFENRAPAVCLAHFAQGVAQHGAYHFERALSHYGKVEKCMAQFPVDDATGELGAFWRALQARLVSSRESVRRQLRNLEEGIGLDGPARHIAVTPEPPPAPIISPLEDNTPHPLLPPAPTPLAPMPPARRPSSSSSAVPPAGVPIIRLLGGTTPPLETQADSEGETAVPRAPTPIPSHQNTDGHLIWMRPDPADWPEVHAFLPDIRADAYILVDRRINAYAFRHNDLVIVDDDEGAGIVPVQPQQSPTATRYPSPIFLGKIEEPPLASGTPSGPAAPKGTVKLSPDSERPLFAEDIIGIVVGIWFGIDVQKR